MAPKQPLQALFLSPFASFEVQLLHSCSRIRFCGSDRLAWQDRLEDLAEVILDLADVRFEAGEAIFVSFVVLTNFVPQRLKLGLHLVSEGGELLVERSLR